MFIKLNSEEKQHNLLGDAEQFSVIFSLPTRIPQVPYSLVSNNTTIQGHEIQAGDLETLTAVLLQALMCHGAHHIHPPLRQIQELFIRELEVSKT
jgi:hypothetical protein